MDMSNLPTDCNIYTNYSSVTISYVSFTLSLHILMHAAFWQT